MRKFGTSDSLNARFSMVSVVSHLKATGQVRKKYLNRRPNKSNWAPLGLARYYGDIKNSRHFSVPPFFTTSIPDGTADGAQERICNVEGLSTCA